MGFMFYANYSSFCATTARYPQEVENPYLALGLCSEAAELYDAIGHWDEFFKELGDCMWYLCRLANAYGFDWTTLIEDAKVLRGSLASQLLPTSVHKLTREAGLIAGRVKKQLRDGHLWNGEQRQEFAYLLRGHMLQVLIHTFLALDALWRLTKGKSGNFDALLQANMDKLTGRVERGTLQGDGDNR